MRWLLIIWDGEIIEMVSTSELITSAQQNGACSDTSHTLTFVRLLPILTTTSSSSFRSLLLLLQFLLLALRQWFLPWFAIHAYAAIGGGIQALGVEEGGHGRGYGIGIGLFR